MLVTHEDRLGIQVRELFYAKKALPVVCWVGGNVGTVFVALQNFNFISNYKGSPQSVGICETQ